jgi:hypothetical protein
VSLTRCHARGGERAPLLSYSGGQTGSFAEFLLAGKEKFVVVLDRVFVLDRVEGLNRRAQRRRKVKKRTGKFQRVALSSAF